MMNWRQIVNKTRFSSILRICTDRQPASLWWWCQAPGGLHYMDQDLEHQPEF